VNRRNKGCRALQNRVSQVFRTSRAHEYRFSDYSKKRSFDRDNAANKSPDNHGGEKILKT